MKQKDRLLEILKTEYGIETSAQLREAVLRLGGLDVSVFCAKETEKERKNNGSSIQPANA